jgi:hypothetical protein
MTEDMQNKDAELLPLEIWHHLIGYIVDFKMLLMLERVSKRIKQIADSYWEILWSLENPNHKLTKNHRFACTQLLKKDYSNKYGQFIMYSKGPILKITMLGDGCVGKSSLVSSLCSDMFTEEYDPTLYVFKETSNNSQ